MPKFLHFLLVVLLFIFGNDFFAQTPKITKIEAERLNIEATNCIQVNHFEKAFRSSRKALTYSYALKDNYFIARSYATIATIFHSLSEVDKAIFYYKKGLFFADKTNSNALKTTIYYHLGTLYVFDKKDYIIGIDYCNKSILHSSKNANTATLILTKTNIIWSYFVLNQYNKGLYYLKQLNRYDSKIGDKKILAVLDNLNAMYNSHINTRLKADFYFKRALKLSAETNQKTALSISHYQYASFLFKTGDYKNAYLNLKAFNTIENQIYYEEKIKKATLTTLKLDLDPYKKEVDSIENQIVQEENNKNASVIQVLLYLVLGVLLLLLYCLFKNDRFKKKINAELTLANEALIVAKDNAIEASKLKSQFVSTITHELRTPLYGVVGITNMLMEEHKELADSPHLASLKFSARYLLSLVNDVLQINRMEENTIVLENLTFNISDEIDMIKNSLSFLAKNNANLLTLEIDPAIPESLIGDKLRFSQIVMNLVSNALKFTKNGEVNISANLMKVEGKLHFIEFQIKDNGPGISESDQEKIFDKFVQVGRNNTDYQGTGLGLSIVKKLLGLFNSTIYLQSKIGEGSIFIFTIAFEHDPEKTIEMINNIQVDISEKQAYRVLVVEDNKINQLVTQKIMKKNNYFCKLADDGFQALDILDNEIFDIILMDINMPVMNGFETSRKIRSKGINTPIIALTAFTKSEIIEEAISAGINDIIIKPFESAQLFQVINNQIYKSNESVEL